MKNRIYLTITGFLLLQFSSYSQPAGYKEINPDYYLIAHRGGVVDGNIPENSLRAIKTAAERGYRMIEIDMRLTKDNVL